MQTLTTLKIACATAIASQISFVSPCAAGPLPCSPDAVSIDNTTLAIRCTQDGWHFSADSASADSKKAWLSMVEMAILANKSLILNDQNGIVWVELDK